MQVGIDGINVDFEKISKRLWSSLYTIYQRTVCKMQTKMVSYFRWIIMFLRDIINSTIAKNRALWQTMSLLWDMMSIMEVHWKQVQYLLMNCKRRN